MLTFPKAGHAGIDFFSGIWDSSPKLADTLDETNKNLQMPIANFSLCHTTCTWFLQQTQELMDPKSILLEVLGRSLLKQSNKAKCTT